jgi:group I intron endonuclease
MGIIYLVTNLVNYKCYVGKTAGSLLGRRRNHESLARRGSKHALHSALRKYGFDKFTWQEICSNVPNNELEEYEIDVIEFVNCRTPKGYNMTSGGDGTKGHKHSVKTLATMSAAQKKRFAESPMSMEQRKTISLTNSKRKATEATKAKMSKSRLGHATSKETKAKIKAALNSPESNQKLRDAAATNRDKRSAALKDYYQNKITPEQQEERRRKGQANGRLGQAIRRLKAHVAKLNQRYKERYTKASAT